MDVNINHMVFGQISYAYTLWLINSTYKATKKSFFDVCMKYDQRSTLFRLWCSRL